MAWYNTLCAQCGFASGPYEAHPRCTDCDEYICRGCSQPGSIWEDEGYTYCQCQACCELENEYYENDEPEVEEDVSDVDFEE